MRSCLELESFRERFEKASNFFDAGRHHVGYELIDADLAIGGGKLNVETPFPSLARVDGNLAFKTPSVPGAENTAHNPDSHPSCRVAHPPGDP